jgi:hypothetical protein
MQSFGFVPIILYGMVVTRQNCLLSLSREEAWELFARCMNSTEEDNEFSRAVLQKLARAIEECDTETRLAG